MSSTTLAHRHRQKEAAGDQPPCTLDNSTAQLLITHNRYAAGWFLAPVMLLATGTSVVISAQFINNMAHISSTAQLLTLARYIFAFSLSSVQFWQECSRAQSRKSHNKLSWHTKLLLLLMGLCDLASYSIFNLGFAACGSAVAAVVLAASGQIFTAAIAVLYLRKRLSWKHINAVVIITAGLVLRSLDDLLVPGATATAANSKGSLRSEGGSNADSSSVHVNPLQLFGISCVVLSALLFSVLGCLYEVLMNRETGRVSQPQASLAVTSVCLAAATMHQLVYTLPNWEQLVKLPVHSSAFSPGSVALARIGYGVITAIHNLVQVRLLATHGALAVGLVNAVRASVVSFVSSWMFCASTPHLCLTYWRAVSALVVTMGAVMWVLAGKPGVALLQSSSSGMDSIQGATTSKED